MIKLSSVRSTGGFSSMSTPPRWVSIASGLSQRAQKTHGPSTSQILLTLVLMMLGGVFVFSNSAYATSDISVSSSGKVSFGKVLASSTGSMVTGEDTLSISTDCEAGANVYATSINGSNTGTSMVNLAAKEQDSGGTNASTYTINTSASAIGSASTLSNNTWGLNTNTTEASNGLYYGLPAYSSSSLPTVIYSGTNSTVPIYYGAKVTNSLAPGTYTGEVLYTVTVNNSCLDYTVKFNKNANDASGDMSDQSILPTGGTLSENSFIYSGYTFLGWSLDPAGKTGTAENGIGTAEDVDFADKASFPGSNESILPGSETTLYAIWEEQPAIQMQNWAGCGKMSANDIAILTDSRDNHKYKVKKLPDGNCWMIQNLTLTATDLVTDYKRLTRADTNIDSNEIYYIPPKNTRYISPSDLENPDIASASNSVDFSVDYSRYPQIGYRASTPTDSDQKIAVVEDTAYYNFYTATLGYSYSNDSKAYGSSPRDICPAGWRLPWASDSGVYQGSAEFYSLALAYNSSSSVWENYIDPNDSSASERPYTQDSTILQNMVFGNSDSFNPNLSTNSAAGFTHAGQYNGSQMFHIGITGYYWSSSIGTTTASYTLGITQSGNIYPQINLNKFYGFAVRCISKYPNVNGYMQDFDTNDLASGESTTLLDKRDGSEYTVKKIGSGPSPKVWMTQNLRLGYDRGHTLTPEDTNIDNNTTYYIPRAGYQGSITDPKTPTNTSSAAYFSSNDNQAKVQYAAASQTGSTNPQDTGYYNFYTATLGFSYYEDGKSSGTSTRDICPKGWKLPAKGSYDTDYTWSSLDYALNPNASNVGINHTDTTSRDNFINNALFGYSGHFNNSQLDSVNSGGIWWSSTIYDAKSGYMLYLGGSNSLVYPQHYQNKNFGNSVRCVAKNHYTINYNANGGTGEMAPSKGYIDGYLSKNTFVKDGYYFAGWSTDPSATTATYGNSATISNDLAPAGGSATLYAIWIESNRVMQTTNSCSTIPTNQANINDNTGTLIDIRDGQEYTIYRFPSTGTAGRNYPVSLNSYCIMTKDLSLGYITGNSVIKGNDLILTTDDSVTATTISAKAKTSDWSTTNSDENKQYINGTNATYGAHSYYSYGAAQAVCPKGWRLPTNAEYSNIASFMGGNNSTGSNTIRGNPYNFIYGGFLDSSGWANVGSYGSYWPSTQYSNTNGYYLYFISGKLGILNNISKYYGMSVRCIAAP